MIQVGNPIWYAALLIPIPSIIWWLGLVLWRRGSISGKAAERLPQVSVIIAGRNEEQFVGDCLKSVIACDYPGDRFEVFFVDDHSHDRTLEIARSYTDRSSGVLTVLSAPDEPLEMGSKKRALTCATKQSSGDILVF